MKKKIMKSGIVIAAFMGSISMSLTAFAGTEGRRAQIQSVGNLDFNNKTIYLAAEDLYYLADEIDLLESTYKSGAVDALNGIGTYFKRDGTLVRDAGANEVQTQEDKRMLSFKSILEGIKTSQSVVSLSQTQAVNREGKHLFYENAAARDNRDLVSTATTDTGYPVYYSAASAENLSAGAAAWVDGTLVKGNGGDNAAHYARGVAFADGRSNPNSVSYQEGYNAGAADADDKVNTNSASYQEGYNAGLRDAESKVNTNSASYQEGYNAGARDADGKVNTNSASYQEGFSAGAADADSKVNTNSASYTDGYNRGAAEGLNKLTKIHLYGEFWTPYGGLQWLNIDAYKDEHGAWISTTSNNQVHIQLTQ